MWPLSEELVITCLKNLPQKDLYECLKVCKQWYHQVSPIFCQQIHLKRHPKNFYELTKKTRLDGSKLGDFVKRLKLYCSRESCLTLTERDFHEMLLNLPKLQAILISWWHPAFYEYMESTPSIYLRNIQEVSYTHLFSRRYARFFDWRLSMNFQLKERITTLRLKNIASLDKSYEDLLSTLSEFANLEYLEIQHKMCRAENEDTETINLTSILNACRSLKSLRLECYHSLGTPVTVDVYSNLTSLELNMPQIENRHLGYIMQHLSNLDAFTLQVDHTPFDCIFRELDQNILTDFLYYLKKIRNVELINKNTHSVNPVESCSSRDELLWNFINSIGGEGCSYNFYFNCVALDEQLDYLVFIKQNQKMYINVTMLPQWISFGKRVDNLTDLFIESVIVKCTTAVLELENVPDKFINALMLNISNKKGYPIYIKSFNQELMLNFSKNKLEECKNFYKYVDYNVDAAFGIMETRVRSNHGYFKGIKIDLLKTIEHLYPSITSLSMENCLFERGNSHNSFSLDLTPFPNIQQLTFYTNILPNQKKLFLQLIDTTNPSRIVSYCFDANKTCRLSRQDHPYHEISNNSKIPLLAIIHSGIQKFIFDGGGDESGIGANTMILQ